MFLFVLVLVDIGGFVVLSAGGLSEAKRGWHHEVHFAPGPGHVSGLRAASVSETCRQRGAKGAAEFVN